MRRKTLLRLSVAAFFLLLGSTLQARPPITSPEGVFALDQGGAAQGVVFMRTLAGYEKQFLSLCKFPAENYPPVLVVLHPASETSFMSSTLRVDSIEGGMPHIQVDLAQGGTDTSQTRRLLATAMLLREYYADKAPVAGSRIQEYPQWLVHGLGLICSPGYGKNIIPSRFLQGQTPPTIEDFLLQRPPADENRSLIDLYDAMAAALLQTALKSPEASSDMGSWIGHFDPQGSQVKTPSWPSSWKIRPIEKRWLLLMADSKGTNEGAGTLLSVPATLLRYDAIINELRTPGHSLALLKNEKGGEFISQNLSSRLIALRLQANPLAGPLLDGTIRLLADLKHLSLKRLEERERQLASTRTDLLKQSVGIREYLDWFEAAKVPVRSGLYDTLLATPESPLKKGPVGHYLDVIEERGW
jgi:hypothetical protein